MRAYDEARPIMTRRTDTSSMQQRVQIAKVNSHPVDNDHEPILSLTNEANAFCFLHFFSNIKCRNEVRVLEVLNYLSTFERSSYLCEAGRKSRSEEPEPHGEK